MGILWDRNKKTKSLGRPKKIKYLVTDITEMTYQRVRDCEDNGHITKSCK